MQWEESRDYLGHCFKLRKHGTLVAVVFRDKKRVWDSRSVWAYTITPFSGEHHAFASKNDSEIAKREAEKALKEVA